MKRAFLIIILISAFLMTSCATEELKQVGESNVRDSRTVNRSPKLHSSLKAPAARLERGTKAVSDFVGQPENPIETQEEFDVAVSKVEKQAEKRSSWLGWGLIGIGALTFLLESELTGKKLTGPIGLICRIGKKLLNGKTESKKPEA